MRYSALVCAVCSKLNNGSAELNTRASQSLHLVSQTFRDAPITYLLCIVDLVDSIVDTVDTVDHY